MSKRLFTLLALLMVASLVLAACGTAEPAAEEPAAEEPAAEEPAAEEPMTAECTDAIGCVEVADGFRTRDFWCQCSTRTGLPVRC